MHLVDLETYCCRLAALDLMCFVGIGLFAYLHKHFVQLIVIGLGLELGLGLGPVVVLLEPAVCSAPRPPVVLVHQELDLT